MTKEESCENLEGVAYPRCGSPKGNFSKHGWQLHRATCHCDLQQNLKKINSIALSTRNEYFEKVGKRKLTIRLL